MKRKIFKYMKNIMALFMIFSLIIPGYAALSSSDGSAFITKEEFDSFSSEINSRITTFEAGINSKIDSQVTSYLDRNGIWNGKKVDLEEDNKNVLYGIKAANGTTTKIIFNIKNNALDIGNKEGLIVPVVAGNNGDFLLAKKMPKTGLAFIVTKNGAEKTTDTRAVVGPAANGTINLANARWIYDVALTIYAGVWDTKVGVARNKTSAQFVGGGTGISIICPEMPTGTVLFFVKKNEDLWYNLSEKIDNNTAGTYGNDPNTLYFWGDDANPQTTRTYVFDSVSIY